MTDEPTIKTMLDALAEFESQRSLLDIQKSELLSVVQVPSEVQDIVSDGNKQIATLQRQARQQIEALDAEAEALLSEIVIPDEIRAAYEAILQKKAAVTAKYNDSKTGVYHYATRRESEIRSVIEARVRSAFDAVAARKAEIEIEFGDKAAAVDENIAKLKAEIEKAVESHGASVKGSYKHAVYSPGRVTWNTDMLDGMVAVIPQIGQARKVGKPSVSIRNIR